MTYDLFLAHAWRFHDDWVKLGNLLDEMPGLSWRNFSVPWYDPAMDPNTDVGKAFIDEWLEGQIIPTRAVLFLSGVYASASARKWLDKEVEIARRYEKPIIAVPVFGTSDVPEEVAAIADAIAPFDAKEIISVLDDHESSVGASASL